MTLHSYFLVIPPFGDTDLGMLNSISFPKKISTLSKNNNPTATATEFSVQQTLATSSCYH